MDVKDGEYLIKLARSAIKEYMQRGTILRPTPASPVFLEKKGVFVTLETYPEMELRGCIGYVRAIKEIIRAVPECAINSAFGDPRFPELSADELEHIVIEISILTEPVLIIVREPKEYLNNIKVGVDGLIVEYEDYSGLLLPQVPIEWRWDEKEFLSHTCEKAGLPPNIWLQRKINVYKFQAQIFSETEPNGKVIEKKLLG